MMTQREAHQRVAVFNCRFRKTDYGDYRLVHNAWRTGIEDRAYYSDDLEDIVHTAAAINRFVQEHHDDRDR
jgi:hypothetical protein